MDDQANTGASGAPSGTPAGAASGSTSGNFVRDRARQMAASMQPAPGEPPAPDAQHEQAGEQRQQQPAAPAKIKVGDAEYDAADVQNAIAERAEAQSRKATLPASADAYEIKLPDGWVGPEGVKFELDKANPAWKAVREIAHKYEIPQQAVSELAGAYASTRIGEEQRNATLRDVNMRQLGVAGPQRIEAVATWLQARAGAEGKATGDFLRQFPSAPIVKTMENLMRAFSSQGGSDFSQSHRAEQEDPGKIPGYENMNFTQRRVAQMTQMLSRPGGYRGGGGRRGE